MFGDGTLGKLWRRLAEPLRRRPVLLVSRDAGGPTDDEVAADILSVPTHYIVTGRFEVIGGNGNWTSTTNWSASSGGSSGSSVPAAGSNNVTFDGNSGNMVVDGSASCNALTMTSYASTFSGSAALEVRGNLTLGSGMTNSYTGTLSLTGTGSQTWTSAGKSLDNATVNTATSYALADAAAVTNALTLTQGTLSTGTNFALTCASFSSSNSSTRALTLGTTTLTLTGTGTVWGMSTTTNLTLSAASSTIVISTSSGATTFAGGGLTYGNLTISGADAVNSRTFTGTNTFATFTSGANKLAFTNAQTATAWVLTGCKSITGNIVCASGTVTAPAGCDTSGSTASGGATFSYTDGTPGTGWTLAVAAPVADFTGTPLTGAASLSVAFTDASTNTPTSWLWEKSSDGGSTWANFASTPTVQNPTESFASGTWSVRLTATNAGGSNAKTRTNYITSTAASSPQQSPRCSMRVGLGL